MIHRKIVAFIISLLLGLSLTGCKVDNGLVTTLQLRDKFNQPATTFVSGDPITFSLSIKNDSTSSTTLTFPTEYQYDFVIKDTTDTEIWRWSSILTFAAVNTSIRLGPSDIHNVTLLWDQHIDDVPTKLPPGNYIAEGYFVDYGAVIQIDIEII